MYSADPTGPGGSPPSFSRRSPGCSARRAKSAKPRSTLSFAGCRCSRSRSSPAKSASARAREVSAPQPQLPPAGWQHSPSSTAAIASREGRGPRGPCTLALGPRPSRAPAFSRGEGAGTMACSRDGPGALQDYPQGECASGHPHRAVVERRCSGKGCDIVRQHALAVRLCQLTRRSELGCSDIQIYRIALVIGPSSAHSGP